MDAVVLLKTCMLEVSAEYIHELATREIEHARERQRVNNYPPDARTKERTCGLVYVGQEGIQSTLNVLHTTRSTPANPFDKCITADTKESFAILLLLPWLLELACLSPTTGGTSSRCGKQTMLLRCLMCRYVRSTSELNPY